MAIIAAHWVAKIWTGDGKIPQRSYTQSTLPWRNWSGNSTVNERLCWCATCTGILGARTYSCMATTSLSGLTQHESSHSSCPNFAITSRLSILGSLSTNRRSQLLEWLYGESWRYRTCSQWRLAFVAQIKVSWKTPISSLNISCNLVDGY